MGTGSTILADLRRSVLQLRCFLRHSMNLSQHSMNLSQLYLGSRANPYGRCFVESLKPPLRRFKVFDKSLEVRVAPHHVFDVINVISELHHFVQVRVEVAAYSENSAQ